MNKLANNTDFETATDRVLAMIVECADKNTTVDIEDDLTAYDQPAYFDFTPCNTYEGGEPVGRGVEAELVGIVLNGKPFTRDVLSDWFGETLILSWEEGASEAAEVAS
jgi:hypothetical protein